MQKTWDEWAEHHAMIFCMISDSEMRMLMEWTELFQLAGWTPAEAWDATDWLALNNPPKYRMEQLFALQARIRQQRGRLAQQPVEGEVWGTCTECLSTGRVIVPNPKPDPLGRGCWYTMAVACTCALGNCYRDRANLMGLRDYEFAYPDWRQKMAQHEELLRRTVRTSAFTRSLDQALRAVIGRRNLTTDNTDNTDK